MEYHHIGYDITAGRILENVLRYIDEYSDRQKVFFITGARSAGGVANLLAKKLIDKFGTASVYGYTFNAVASINGNMIPEGSKIPNLKYAPIMNIYNDDEIMVMFTSEETNMYKYGTNVHTSLSENYKGKVRKAFNRVHPKGYDILSAKKAKEFIFNYLSEIKSGIVHAFAGALDLNNVFSGETDEEKQILADHWQKMYETTPNNEYYEEYNNICKLRLIGVKLDSLEDYVAYLLGQNNSDSQRKETATSIPPKNNDKSEINSNDNFVRCVEKLAKLYINHVGTYKKILQTSSNDVSNHRSTNRAYEYLIDNGVTIGEYDSNENGFTLEAPTSHGNMIYAEDGWMYYVYDENSEGDGMIGNWHVRDDCSGFIKAALKLTGKEFSGFDTSSINGYDKLLAPILYHSGYDLYQCSNGVWCKISFSSLDRSSIVVEPALQEGEVMGLDFLKPGDILVTSGHAEIYIGNNYNIILPRVTNRNFKKKGYVWTDADVTQTDTSPGYTNKGTFENPIYVKEGTFSWGSVRDEFPVESSSGDRHYFYYDTSIDEHTHLPRNCFWHCECGKKPSDNAELHHASNCSFKNENKRYEVIWRKRQ